MIETGEFSDFLLHPDFSDSAAVGQWVGSCASVALANAPIASGPSDSTREREQRVRAAAQRRAGADRARAARRDRPQRLGDGDPGRRRPHGDGLRAGARRGLVAFGRARRPRGSGGDAPPAGGARQRHGSAGAGTAARARRHRRPRRPHPSAGSPTDLRVEGDATTITPALDLCAYRIVQEALTNAIKHAGPARAEVRVRWASDALELEVCDDGRGPSGRAMASQAGTASPACASERRSTAGASRLAPASARGFAVRARLPLVQEQVR